MRETGHGEFGHGGRREHHPWGDVLRDSFPETDAIPNDLVALMLRLSDERIAPRGTENAPTVQGSATSCPDLIGAIGGVFSDVRAFDSHPSSKATPLPLDNRATRLFTSDHRFGLGGVPLGNEFNKIADKDAEATLEAAWAAGTRYYDVAPWYGFGLSERRFGHFLHNRRRDEFLISSKVGKLFKAARDNTHEDYFPLSDSPNNIVFDYTADGVRRSVEDSLQRMGINALDVVFAHDLSPDFAYFPDGWEEQWAIAEKGAFPELSKMRDEGLIKAWGIGVNCPQPLLKLLDVADPDVCLCAAQYSLVDHANAVNEVFPAYEARNVSLVIGSALNAGFIPGSPRFNYGKTSHEIDAKFIAKRDALQAVADRHGVDLRTAALQFSAAPDVAVALVVGAGSAEQATANWNAMQAKIPAAFWDELRHEKLIEPAAATPKD